MNIWSMQFVSLSVTYSRFIGFKEANLFLSLSKWNQVCVNTCQHEMFYALIIMNMDRMTGLHSHSGQKHMDILNFFLN